MLKPTSVSVSTAFVGVAALLLVAANDAQAQNFDNLHFNTATPGNYGAGASLSSSNSNQGMAASSVSFDNVAIGATQPPKTQNQVGAFGSWTQLTANVTRTRTSSEYTVVPELGASVDSSSDIPHGTTNALNIGATYTNQFWLDNPNASRPSSRLLNPVQVL